MAYSCFETPSKIDHLEHIVAQNAHFPLKQPSWRANFRKYMLMQALMFQMPEREESMFRGHVHS